MKIKTSIPPHSQKVTVSQTKKLNEIAVAVCFIILFAIARMLNGGCYQKIAIA